MIADRPTGCFGPPVGCGPLAKSGAGGRGRCFSRSGRVPPASLKGADARRIPRETIRERVERSLAGAVAAFAIAGALLPCFAFADTVYVVSFTDGELIRYDTGDPAGTRETVLSAGTLVSPGALAFGPDGCLYIGENGDGSTFAPRISKFEPSTLTLSTVYPFSAFELFPGSLVFLGDDLLIGRNPFFSNTGPIVKLTNPTGGTPAVGDYSSGGSLASSPGLALGGDGRLYVSDQTYNFVTSIASGPVKGFDAAGAYAGEVVADGTSGLAGPTGLAIGGDTLYIASVMSGDILEVDLATGVTRTFAASGNPFEVGLLAVLSEGGLLSGSVSGSGNVYHFDSTGALLSTFASGLGQIGGIAVVPIPEPPTAYEIWIGESAVSQADAAVGADPNGDGVPNGVAFVSGAPGAWANASPLLPAAVRADGDVVFTFRRVADTGGLAVEVEYGEDLATWRTCEDGKDGVVVAETPDGFAPGIDRVEVRIPAPFATGRHLFVRLVVR